MSAKQVSSNSQLLYSEYINTNNAKHVTQLIENKKKEKPTMKFTKSSALSRALDLLPRLKQGAEELQSKNSDELNIEVCDENCPVIEMNVAIPKEIADGAIESSNEYSDEFNSELGLNVDNDSSEESSSGSEESDSEDTLTSFEQSASKLGNKDIVKNDELTAPNLIKSDPNGQAKNSSVRTNSHLIEIYDISDEEPPVKKLCQ